MAILANGQKIDYIPAPDNYIIHKSRTVALNRSIPVRQKIKAIRMDGFYFFGERWSPENEPENRHDKHLQDRLCRFQRHGNLPRPKNVPPARFLNGLSSPISAQKIPVTP